MVLKEMLEDSPIIAAINSEEDVELCTSTECKVVFIIRSSLTSVKPMIKKIKDSGRIAIVHADLVAGLNSKEVAVEFLQEQGADGIISTKPALIKKAKELGMYGVIRAFIIDSAAMETTKKQMENIKPDAVELMPGIIPRVISEFTGFEDIALIASGLIRDKNDVITAFDAGVDAVSASNQQIWFM